MPMGRQRFASGHKSHATRNQRDPQPAQRTDLLVQRKLRHQRKENISQRSRRQHISEIRPRKGIHVGRKERQQKQNSNRHPRIQQGHEKGRQMVQRDVPGLLHSM